MARSLLDRLRAGGARLFATVVIGITGAWLALSAFGHLSTTMGPFQVRLEMSFGRGVTDIGLPPLGTLRADTHLAPLHLSATLEGVDVDTLQPFLASPGGPARLAEEVERQALDRTLPFAMLILGIGSAGALVLGTLVFRQPRRAMAALLSGLIAIGGAEALTAATYDARAFLAPSYTGTLRLAPQLFGPVEGTIRRVGYFRDELERIVASAGQAYAAAQANPLGRGDEITVLHISDVHLSTLGYGFALRLAQAFDVDLVLDTGDTGSFGTKPDQAILTWVPRFDRPYVFVRGSHDSLAFQRVVGRYTNATVLDGTTTTVDGLTIYGLGDPYFVAKRGAPKSDEEITRLVESAQPQLLDDVRSLPSPPDLVAVHEERMAATAAGFVPLVASGHFHEERSRVQDGTLFLQVGTTGGAGPTGFSPQGGVPFSAEILYFRPNGDGTNRLVAWDVVQEFPGTGSFSVQRHVVATDYGDLTPSASRSLTPSPSTTPLAAGSSAPTA